jgi:O-antigen/teichoic acid export membrane protein
LSGIKQLANQTAWYGLSNIIGRFINYLLTPILTSIYAPAAFGDISLLFAIAAFLNIIYTYGMETSYFRFNQIQDENKVFNNAFSSLLLTTLLFSTLLIVPSNNIATYLSLNGHNEYILYVVGIVGLDTLAVLPFSKLRHEGRPRKFAFIKISNILINVLLVIFFLQICKPAYERGDDTVWKQFYNPKIGIGYVFISQLVASGCTILLLVNELKSYRFDIDKKLFKEIFIYSSPLIIVGFGGMINETIDRFMIIQRFNGSVEAAKAANGIYSANNKLAILIVIFIQTFRMGAEPFFFKTSAKEDAKITYARIMNLFVIACCCCFLGVVLFLDVWKYFMGVKNNPSYAEGLYIVPMLMVSKIFLGIYYNLSIWYKLTNKNTMGAVITMIGAGVTILINYLFIPSLGYLACAIANISCYGIMMLMSYWLGNKYYSIPYHWMKSLGYMVFSYLLYLAHHFYRAQSSDLFMIHLMGVALSAVFIVIVLVLEKQEFKKIPYLQKIYFNN